MAGRRNILFGWIWLFMGVLLSLMVQIFLKNLWMNYESRAADFFPGQIWENATMNWLIFSLTNIAYGNALMRVKVSRAVADTGSYLMIVAGIVYPIAGYLSGFPHLLENPWPETLRYVGVAFFLAAVIIQFFAWARNND